MKREKQWKVVNERKARSKEEILDILLEARGIEKSAYSDFLSPKKPESFSFTQLGIDEKQLKKFVSRIKKAKKNKERVVVYGDYDVDGITATAIMWETLNACGLSVMPYIPNRFNDGYGLREESVARLIDTYPDLSLIVAVDNGIVAQKAINFALSKNVDVLVTDHHEMKDKPIVPYIHTTLTSGAAIAYFVSLYLSKSMKVTLTPTLELACLGVVADQMPLIGVNRSIVYWGLKDIATSDRVGMQELIAVASLDKQKISTYEINYQLAPRINASGRLEDGLIALRLLCSKSKKTKNYARELNELNMKRQEIVEHTIKRAQKMVDHSDRVIIIADNALHEGVIGLAASKLVETFHKPAIVLSIGQSVAKASARSIVGFNIIHAIREHEHLIIEGGGHEMAAGFSIDPSNIENFREAMNNSAQKTITEDMLVPTIFVDTFLDIKIATLELVEDLAHLEPFGVANYSPKFIIENVQIVSGKAVGTRKAHLKCSIKKENIRIDAIAFGFGELLETLDSDNRYDIVSSLEKNEWQGRVTPQLVIKDIKLHQ